jgi:S1-C subfamily serine protease
MPFLDNQLSPLTDKGHPLSVIDRDWKRRKDLDIGQDHVTIPSRDTDGYAVMSTPVFSGEVEWNRSGIDGDKERTFVAYMANGPPMVFRNKSVDQIVDELKKKNLNWRLISPLVADSLGGLKKTSSSSEHFVPFISNVLSGCFKIESECYAQKLKEIGSSFYVRENMMLTCAHVISKKSDQDLRDVAVFVIDGDKKYWATVVDIDYDLDVALLYCDATKHSVLPIKSVDDVDIGHEIICVGSPYGYDNNVTKGIVSSKDREIKSGKSPYFFMDLAVYPGSSGGPVVDSNDGKVIGMAAVIVESVGNYGINAGLPIDVCLKRFNKQLSVEDI